VDQDGARRGLQDRRVAQGREVNCMDRRRFAWWPLLHRERRLSREPGAALFQGLRIRLTLWYSGVLGAAFVLFGVALYFGVQYLLLFPVEGDLSRHVHMHMRQLVVSPYSACSSTTFVPGPVPPNQPAIDSG